MKKLLAALVGTLLLWSAPLCLGAEAVEVSVPSAVLMEKETGTVLYAKDEHTPREPASVTKIMTLLLTMEAVDSGNLSWDTVVTASAHAASMGGSQIWLKENEQMTVDEMVKAVCVVSANDCAVALAEHLAGSEEAFVERMNRRAAELEMHDTVFKNATGLPAEGHVTSAWDIARMSRELILHHPDIRRYTTIRMDTLRDGASQLVNTNKLLRTFTGCTGLKTGSTDAARYCLSATAERDGMELIAVVLKGDTSAKRFDDARTLLSYGFATYTLLDAAPEEPLPEVPVRLGTADAVRPVPGEGEKVLLERSVLPELRQTVTLAESVEAPVAEGDRIGALTVWAGDTPVAEIPLLAAASVPRLTFRQALERILRDAFTGGFGDRNRDSVRPGEVSDSEHTDSAAGSSDAGDIRPAAGSSDTGDIGPAADSSDTGDNSTAAGSSETVGIGPAAGSSDTGGIGPAENSPGQGQETGGTAASASGNAVR